MQGSANLNIMIKAARRAGKALVKDFREVENLQVSTKGPGDFVTKADREAERLIKEDLMGARPTYGWLGEETGWESAWRAFTRPGSFTVNVHFLEPFDPAALADRKEVCAEARSRMLAAMV